MAGREASGIVPADGFARTCDEVCDLLRGLVDARSGRAMVRDIVRARQDPFDAGAPADLIVLWQEESPTDVVDSPHVGRVGPLPYFRSGGHSSRGFVAVRGAGMQAASRLPDITAYRLPALLLDLMKGKALAAEA